ncbi:MAG TPA: hypothetical protein P5081_00965 [Phycisphaerae bacterium]|nr:hypothetical protein [Phycisphaerae bacterium]HRW51423.1 hypothetical protein [Phycisphaerae bacterium]
MTSSRENLRTRRNIRLIAGSLVGVALAALLWLRPWQSLDLGDPAQYTIVDIESIDWREPPNTQSTFTRCQDAKTIAALVDQLASARRIMDCKCLHAGFIRLTDAEGAVRELQLIPGHEKANVDLRYDGGRYQLDRSKLQRLFDSIGATLPGEN